MKKLAAPVILLLFFSSLVFPHDDVSYPRKSPSISDYLDYHVPSEYPTIQAAVNAAVARGGRNSNIIVDEGEYREAVIASGLKNMRLIGREARILPPPSFEFTEPPVGDNFPTSSLTVINCENIMVEGFTFIGDDFAESLVHNYPMGNAIHLYNSSGTIANNIIFNYFDGIFFQVDDPRWMQGEISDNYIHNCLWSGILATGSHNLSILKNKIAFTIPKELSVSVGIWTDGGIGTISGNHISSYKPVDYPPQHTKESGKDLWPASFRSNERLDYQVSDNTFEQSVTGMQFSNVGKDIVKPHRFLRKTLRINNYFISVEQDNHTNNHYKMVMLPE